MIQEPCICKSKASLRLMSMHEGQVLQEVRSLDALLLSLSSDLDWRQRHVPQASVRGTTKPCELADSMRHGMQGPITVDADVVPGVLVAFRD
eukprot:11124849-Alexandrium_andersonii.AAC.1